MKRILPFLLALLLLPIYAATAQVPFNPGDAAAPHTGYPTPFNPLNYNGVLRPQQCPDGSLAALNTCGDGRDGFSWIWDSFNRRMELRPPKILYGPGAITAATTALTQNAWNELYSSVGAHGYRGGLTAYAPVGNYDGDEDVAISTGSTANTTYTLRVLIGTSLQTSGAQQGILIIPRYATNGTTAAGNAILHFASTAGILPGMVVADMTTGSVIDQAAQVLSVTPTTVTMTANASGGGVGNGDLIVFGFVVGWGGPYTWPGAASLVTSLHGSFTTAAIPCLAAQNSDQQCEFYTQLYTTGAGSFVLGAGGAASNPPYTTKLQIRRLDGGYGGN